MLCSALQADAATLVRCPGPAVDVLGCLEDPAAVTMAAAQAALQLWHASAVVLTAALLVVARRLRPAAPPALTLALLALVCVDLVSVTRTANILAPRELTSYRPALLDAVRA